MSEFNQTTNAVRRVMEAMHAYVALEAEREVQKVKEEGKASKVVSVARWTQCLVDNAMTATKRARNAADACACDTSALKGSMDDLLRMSAEVLDDTMNSLRNITNHFVAKKDAASTVLEAACAAVGMTKDEARAFYDDAAGQDKKEAVVALATEAAIMSATRIMRMQEEVTVVEPCLKSVEAAMQLIDASRTISEEVEKMKFSVEETERAIYTAGSAIDALNAAKTEASKVLSSGYSKSYWPNGNRLDKAMNAAIDTATKMLDETRKKAEIAKEQFKVFSDDLISSNVEVGVACDAAGIKPNAARSFYYDTYYKNFLHAEVDVPLAAAFAMMKDIEVGDNEDTECDEEEEEPAPKRVCRTSSSCA